MRALRIATVFVPSLAALVIALGARASELHVAGAILLGLWCVMTGTLLMRFARERCAWSELDVLTATGRATAWTALAAMVAAHSTGWASFSVLGILGLGVVCLATTWTTVFAGGDEPWRAATIERAVLPEVATEGDPLREEVRIANARIPMGLRLFATGRALRHGAVTRYAIGSEASRAEVVLESELGPARRGEHQVPPLTLWLGDVLGLTRTPPVLRGECAFAVLPRPARVDGARELLGDGRDAMTSRPAHKLPTEGTFRIREYAPGDDTRRIHWVRSLQANQLVVRLPDEIPPAEPAVRLVLDNYFCGTEAITSGAPDELLDAMVRVWLGIGKALVETGTRVTLVTTVDKGGTFVRAERPLVARSGGEGARLGARTAWQAEVPLATLLDKRAARQIIVSCRPRELERAPAHTWVVVPHNGWTSPEPWPAPASVLRLPFPVGSADNRLARRRAERRRNVTRWQDRALFSQLCAVPWRTYSGEYVARPDAGGVTLQVIP